MFDGKREIVITQTCTWRISVITNTRGCREPRKLNRSTRQRQEMSYIKLFMLILLVNMLLLFFRT